MPFPSVVHLISWFTAAFGLAFIVGWSKISLPARKVLEQAAEYHRYNAWGWFCGFFLELIECPACFGFWEGFLYGLAVEGFMTGLKLGCMTAGVNLLLAVYAHLSHEEPDA